MPAQNSAEWNWNDAFFGKPLALSFADSLLICMQDIFLWWQASTFIMAGKCLRGFTLRWIACTAWRSSRYIGWCFGLPFKNWRCFRQHCGTLSRSPGCLVRWRAGRVHRCWWTSVFALPRSSCCLIWQRQEIELVVDICGRLRLAPKACIQSLICFPFIACTSLMSGGICS